MTKRTINLAAICIVLIGVATTYTLNAKKTAETTQNVSVEGGIIDGAGAEEINTYQKNILDAITKQQLDTFEKLTKSLENNESDTLSDVVAKDVFKGYLEYNASGDFNREDIAAITVANLKDQDVKTSTISINQIKLTKSNTSNLKTYSNQIAKIQNSLAKAITSIDPNKIRSDHIKALYLNTASLYMRQPVPETISQIHLDIINSYRDYAAAFDLLALQEKDPARALLGVEQAKRANDNLATSFDTLRRMILVNKIAYIPTDPAYGWINPAEGSTIKTE